MSEEFENTEIINQDNQTGFEKSRLEFRADLSEKKEQDNTIWENSRILRQQQENLEKGLGARIAFLDIDSTLVAGNDEETKAAIKALRDKGFSIVFLSARPTEWQMRDATYDESYAKGGFNRPLPVRQLGAGKHVTAEELMPEEILDPDIMGGANGTQVAVLDASNKYYHIDEEITGGLDPETWRLNGYDMIDYINIKAKLLGLDLLGRNIEGVSPIDYQQSPSRLSDIDIVDAFDFKEIGHKPHDFKIACHFNSIEDKQKFRRLLKELRDDGNVPKEMREYAQNIELIDDSNPDRKITVKRGELEEQITDYTMHLVPKGTGKEYAADHVMEKVTEALNKGKNEADKIKTEDIKVFIAGDSYHDLKMGLQAANDVTVNFIIAGGSRLYKYFAEGIRDFGGEEFGKEILDNLIPVDERENQRQVTEESEKPTNLTPDGALHYKYRHPKTGKTRDVYLYPETKKGPASIESAIERLY